MKLFILYLLLSGIGAIIAAQMLKHLTKPNPEFTAELAAREKGWITSGTGAFLRMKGDALYFSDAKSWIELCESEGIDIK